MNSKQMAEIFSDVISVAKSPTILGEKFGRKSRGYIAISVDVIEAMLFAMRELRCRQIDFGTYKCDEMTMYGFAVDGCLVGEINRLNAEGIKTIGCCCGHGRAQGYIQVESGCVDAMIEKGYEKLPVDSENNGQWCFKPKTVLPGKGDTEADDGY